MTDEQNLRTVGDRIESLLEEIGAVGDPRVQEKAEEAVRLLMQFYGAGLGRMLSMVKQDGSAERVLANFADDDVVATLLVLHGLHPLNLEARVQQALDRVRPYLGSHGGNVQLVEVNDGVVRLCLEGSCHGCPSSSVTMRLAIERAIEEAAPDVTRIEVDGVHEPGPALLQIKTAGNGAWIALEDMPELNPGELTMIEVEGTKILICRVEGTLYAYRDCCAACGAVLDGGVLQGDLLACPACQHRYNVRSAGRSINAELHLEPLPLLEEQGTVRMAVPVGSRI